MIKGPRPADSHIWIKNTSYHGDPISLFTTVWNLGLRMDEGVMNVPYSIKLHTECMQVVPEEEPC